MISLECYSHTKQGVAVTLALISGIWEFLLTFTFSFSSAFLFFPMVKCVYRCFYCKL